ncbi:MAG: ribosome-binding factor A [Candidatus Marivariicella framensis]|jgi:ribosome-binding factor A|tara:strand:+ start:1813 stop:2211 length:399 start_codon:yes stop_codon:yes gene_type:complete
MNEETPRQKKIASVIQKELATLLQGNIRKEGLSNLIISITKVHVTVDLAFAKIFLSIFPSTSALEYLKSMQENSFKIRHELSQIMKNQMRRTPQLAFYIDDSLDYIEKIDSALKNPENPISNSDLLPSKQKR